MNLKPAVLLSVDTAGNLKSEVVGSPEVVLGEYRERMKAGGLGAHQLIALTGRGIEKRCKFDVQTESKPAQKTATRKA